MVPVNFCWVETELRGLIFRTAASNKAYVNDESRLYSRAMSLEHLNLNYNHWTTDVVILLLILLHSYFSKSSVLHWITMTSSFTCTAASFLEETRRSIAWNRWPNQPHYRVTQFYFRSWTSTLFSCTLENSRWAISFWWRTNRVTYGLMSPPFKFPITNFYRRRRNKVQARSLSSLKCQKCLFFLISKVLRPSHYWNPHFHFVKYWI